MAPDEDMSMNALMKRWPATIRVVLSHRMLCVGCPIAPFHKIADACREHGVDERLFRADLARATGDDGLAG